MVDTVYSASARKSQCSTSGRPAYSVGRFDTPRMTSRRLSVSVGGRRLARRNVTVYAAAAQATNPK